MYRPAVNTHHSTELCSPRLPRCGPSVFLRGIPASLAADGQRAKGLESRVGFQFVCVFFTFVEKASLSHILSLSHTHTPLRLLSFAAI